MDNNWLFFFLAVLIAFAMLVEGVAILGLKKQIIPLPARILSGLGALAGDGGKSQNRFPVKISSKGLRDYGRWVSAFGIMILISSLIFFFTSVM